MSKTNISREIREAILDGQLKPSPFEKIGSQAFLKFDGIEISASRVSFSHLGKSVFFIDMPADFDRNSDTLLLDGIEGRMQVNISIA